VSAYGMGKQMDQAVLPDLQHMWHACRQAESGETASYICPCQPMLQGLLPLPPSFERDSPARRRCARWQTGRWAGCRSAPSGWRSTAARQWQERGWLSSMQAAAGCCRHMGTETAEEPSWLELAPPVGLSTQPTD